MSKIESRKKMKDIAVRKMVVDAERAAAEAVSKSSLPAIFRCVVEVGAFAHRDILIIKVVQAPASIFMPDKPKIDKRRERRMMAKGRIANINIII